MASCESGYVRPHNSSARAKSQEPGEDFTLAPLPGLGPRRSSGNVASGEDRLTPDCVTLWIGERLGAVERACLRSVLRQGHRLALYCYRQPDGIPEGVEVRDAADILPQRAVFLHSRGSFAPFSDWFRYELQKRALGTWVDADLYLLAPLDGARPYLFGEQEPGHINNAVLRLPPDSPMLPDLLRPFERRTTPRWMALKHYVRARARELIRGGADLGSMPWGITGPDAVTAVATRYNLQSHALPPEYFYPVPWERADWILDPRIGLDDVVTGNSVAIHLWNVLIGSFKDQPAQEGSFLSRLQKEGE